MLDECAGPGDRALGNSSEEAGALLGGPDLPDSRSEEADGGDKRSRRDDAAELLDDDRELDRAEPQSSVLLGDGQARASPGHRRGARPVRR